MSSTLTQCPFIDTEIVPNPNFNELREYPCSDETIYRYYYHWDGFDAYYNCQFCKLIGRKRDVFGCLNEREWKECPYYQSKMREKQNG